MMQSVFLDGNLLDEFINDENLMYLQRSSEVLEKQISVSAREMINKTCHKAYTGL